MNSNTRVSIKTGKRATNTLLILLSLMNPNMFLPASTANLPFIFYIHLLQLLFAFENMKRPLAHADRGPAPKRHRSNKQASTSGISNHKSFSTNNKHKSPLLRLPKEIRLHILRIPAAPHQFGAIEQKIYCSQQAAGVH